MQHVAAEVRRAEPPAAQLALLYKELGIVPVVERDLVEVRFARPSGALRLILPLRGVL